MKKLFKWLLVAMFAFFVFSSFVTEKQIVNAATVTIKCVEANPAEDCNTSMNINYHLPKGVGGSCVWYTEKTDTSWANKKVAFPTSEEQNDAFIQLNAVGESIVQGNVTLTNLNEGTEYMYKVVVGTVESEVHYFKTGSQYFSFIWTSDFHSYYDDARRLKAATANIEECLTMNRGADFILSTGDTIAHGGTYQWWEQLSGASWIKNYMFADTLGNHDWMTKVGTNVSNGASHIFFSANHNNPKNGYSGMENVCYYFYYGDAIFICLNTEEYSQAQYNWCENVLKNCDAQYIFLFQHYQAINKAGGFNSAGYTRWHTLCDTYGVDVFFSGNSHVYVRSKSIYNGQLSTDSTKGTVYVVAPSSDGERGEDPVALTSNQSLIGKSWAGGAKQVASSIVNVTEDEIVLRLINKGGEVLDNVVIPAKRGSSSRVCKDLGGLDKEALEENIYLSSNASDLTSPYLKHPDDASDSIKYIIISNKDTGEVYYSGKLAEGKSRTKLANFPIREHVNVQIELQYWDNTVKDIIVDFISRKDVGILEDYKISNVDSNNINLIWYEELNSDEVKNKELYVNDTLIDTIDLDVFTYQLGLDKLPENEEASIVLKVIGITDDVIYELEVTYTKVVIYDVYAEKITVSKDSEAGNLHVGEKLQLFATLEPSDAVDEVVWTVSNESIAVIDQNGLLKAKAKGMVTVTATSKVNEDVKGSYTINISEAKEPVVTEEPTPVEPTETEVPTEPTVEPTPAEPKKDGCNNVIALFNAISVLGLVIVFRKRSIK